MLATAALPGDNAVAPRWTIDPKPAVRAIGTGLRWLHDRAPVDACPFSWSLDDRTRTARARIESGVTRPAAWHAEHSGLSAADALSAIGDPPSIDRLVVCHGDACAPNTIVSDDSQWSGHVDIGALGVADRWADLAIATWSTDWNYGPGWQEALLDAYGIEPDTERTAYYRLLWDLT